MGLGNHTTHLECLELDKYVYGLIEIFDTSKCVLPIAAILGRTDSLRSAKRMESTLVEQKMLNNGSVTGNQVPM